MSVLYVSALFLSYKASKFGNSFYPGVFLCGVYLIIYKRYDFRNIISNKHIYSQDAFSSNENFKTKRTNTLKSGVRMLPAEVQKLVILFEPNI